MLSRADYVARWSELHGGYDPATGSRVVRLWLAAVHWCARPLAAARVPPDAVTALAVVAAAVVVVLAPISAVAAAAVVVLSGLLDGLDGAVAVLQGRASRFGFVLDSVADRVADGLWLVALWRAGAAPLWCLLAAAAVVLLEYTRARAAGAGMAEIGVVTVGERPTRVVLTVLGLALAPTAGAAAVFAVGLVGWLQLLAVVRGRLAP